MRSCRAVGKPKRGRLMPVLSHAGDVSAVVPLLIAMMSSTDALMTCLLLSATSHDLSGA